MRLLLVALALLLAAPFVSACGGGDDSPVVATVERTDRDGDEDEDGVAVDDAESAVTDADDATRPARRTVPNLEQRDDPTTPASLLSADARRAFAALSNAHPGALGAAITPVGSTRQPETVGDLQRAVAWSTIKVPIAAAVLAAGATDRDRADIEAALTVSDNAAAMRLWERLGGGAAAASAVETQLRRAGDGITRVQSSRLRPEFTPFGQTPWSLDDQARFMAGIDCLASGSELRSTMGRVTSSQRWGLGSTGSSTPFKGGWGPGTDPGVAGGYLDRQMGIVTIDGRELAVAITAAPASGSHESGTAALDAITTWLVEHVDASAAANAGGSPCR